MSRLTRDGTAEPNSRDQTLRRERGLGKFRFPCSADHKQDWQPYPVDAQPAESDDHTHTHCQYISIHTTLGIHSKTLQFFLVTMSTYHMCVVLPRTDHLVYNIFLPLNALLAQCPSKEVHPVVTHQ